MKQHMINVLLCMASLCACHTDPLAKLPDFSFRLYDSVTIINSKNFPNNKPIVLFRFESDCRDCQKTTDSLLQCISKIKNAQFYLLSTEKFSEVRLFRDYYKLYGYPNVIVGQDYYRFLSKHFNTHHTPFIALYNSDKRLVGMYDGKPLIKELVTAIKKLN